jgi:hypothetical protein
VTFLEKVESQPYLKKMAGLFFALFIIQLILGFTIIFRVSAKQTNDFLGRIIETANKELRYENGKWDTSHYDINPEIPGSYRLYVFNEDGFVIDRWRPIGGLLDTSEYKQLNTHLNKYNTFITVTDQKWRMFSLPITNTSRQAVGVIAIGKLISSNVDLDEIDENLEKIGQNLLKTVKTNGDELIIDNTITRLVPYDVSFQIVDQHNKIHLKSDSANSIDRLPNYIEPSYITNYLKQPAAFRIEDNKTGELFRVVTSPIKDKTGNAIGTIIVGRSIESVKNLLRIYVLLELLIGLPLFAAGLWLTARWTNQKNKFTKPAKNLLDIHKLNVISFNKKESALYINDSLIPITYASNQYYLCLILFSAPKKKWELDEIQDKIGDPNTTWRKTYDAMNSINKKTDKYLQSKLVVTNNKTFQINPKLASKVVKRVENS